MTYIETLLNRFNSNSHHAFLLHGATRDLQLGTGGSCSLVEHIGQAFQALDRLTVAYKVGIGWTFTLESDRGRFAEIVGLTEASAGDFSSFGVESNVELPLDSAGAIALIDAAMRQDDVSVCCIVDRAELVCPATSYDRMPPQDKAILSILQTLASDWGVVSTGNILIMITDSLPDLHESLRLASGRYFALEIAPPDQEERAAIAGQVLPALESAGVTLELSPQEFSAATSMMTRYGIMDILYDARQAGRLTRAGVAKAKAIVLSQEYGDILTNLEGLPNGYDGVAGLEKLKAYFSQEIVENMIAGNLQDVPAGVLIAGAPGQGKTHFMRAVAGASGIPVIELNIGRLLGSYVGQSERNLERALTAIKSATPCFVLIDEIETSFPDRASAAPAGDSGIGQRILKRMLEVLSDPSLRGKVVWVGITNYPQKLDAALSRAGRFDMTVAFLPPSENERAQLIELYANKYQVQLPSKGSTLESLARGLAGYTNAEIESVARKARQLQHNGGHDDTDAMWIDAVKRVRPNTRNVQAMTLAALQAVNDADLLPVEYVDRWRKLQGQEQDQDQDKASAKERAKLF